MKTFWRKVPTTAFSLVLLFLYGISANATVVFDWATVANPGNAPDQDYGSGQLFGAVADTYRISKHEVTNDQYRDFLNAVDATGTNPNGVYSSNMGDAALRFRGGIDFDAAAANGAKYSSKTNFGNKPVNHVSFFDAMRFVNWLENGQPTDGSGTESGVYTIATGTNETRNASATFFIPSEDEWYKAAYHQPASQGGDSDDYWFYSTASNTDPTVATASATGDISNPGMNVANYESGADWNGQNGHVTSVGSAGTGSTSFYGTFDQGGNLVEWNEAVGFSSLRGLRGGSWIDNTSGLAASNRRLSVPSGESIYIGFRVASIPAPSTLSCDFSGNAVCDVTDLDLMQSLGPIAPGVPATGNEEFDLNKDGTIDVVDRDQWLGEAAIENGFASPYKRGDANLDGVVDGQDFIAWNGSKFTSSLLWSEGNFNGDGAVDGQDFILWNGNKFTSSDGVSVVPEPGSGGLMLSPYSCWEQQQKHSDRWSIDPGGRQVASPHR